MAGMTIEIGLVLGILVVMLGLLACTRISPDAVLISALTGMLAVPVPTDTGWRFGVVPLVDGLSGFANPGMIAVGVLFVVVTGLRETGTIDWIAGRLLGRPASERGAMLSVFLNNTPVVAMMIPAIQDWSKKLGIHASRLLIPLSYAAILGGTCSLIGTSTNLVVAGLAETHDEVGTIGMFDITWVGLPTALIGCAFLLFVGPKLLPSRSGSAGVLGDAREYTLELVVPDGSGLAGKTVDEAGLRNLPGCFLIEVGRGDVVLAPVSPEHVLRSGDRLLFAGVVDSIRELVNTRGLELTTDQVFKLDSPRYRRRLFEVVLAPTGSLIGRTIREARFRNRFNGAVIAVARNGERVRGRIGDIRMKGGDLLLVEAQTDFLDRAEGSREFLLSRSLEDSTPRRHSRAPIALAILLAMVCAATFGMYPMVVAAFLAAGAMILTRCCTVTEARESVDWSVLIVIGAALGIGAAMEHTGAAELVARGVVGLVGENPWLILTAVYLVTAVLTAVISNNAAVALMFSITLAIAEPLGMDVMPLIIAIMMAGSASFATPIGYQTNLMVMGPGGYTFADFLRIGVPMNVVVGICTVVITPMVYPF